MPESLDRLDEALHRYRTLLSESGDRDRILDLLADEFPELSLETLAEQTASAS